MLRLLLDHNFPSAPFDFEKLDRTVRFEALVKWRPAFAKVSTEDWIVHLAAGFDGFDGVVTNDAGQLEQEPEVIALDQTRLSVITWRRGTNEPGPAVGQPPCLYAADSAQDRTGWTLDHPPTDRPTAARQCRAHRWDQYSLRSQAKDLCRHSSQAMAP